MQIPSHFTKQYNLPNDTDYLLACTSMSEPINFCCCTFTGKLRLQMLLWFCPHLLLNTIST